MPRVSSISPHSVTKAKVSVLHQYRPPFLAAVHGMECPFIIRVGGAQKPKVAELLGIVLAYVHVADT